MKTREQNKRKNPNEKLPVMTQEQDWRILQGYYDESWFPCKIIRREEELPKHHRKLWRQKEDQCKQFGTASHEVVFWFEDDPPAYSILPSNYMRWPHKKLKSEATRDQDLNTTEPFQENNGLVARLAEETNKLEDNRGEVMESQEETQQVLKETKQRQDATKLAVLEAKCEMATEALKKEQAKLQQNDAKLLKDAEERGALKEEIKILRARNKDRATKYRKQTRESVDDDELLPTTMELQENLEDLHERLEQKEKALGDLRQDKDDMRKDKGDLREQVKALQREIATLAAELEKKDVLIGILKTKLPKQCDECQVIDSGAMGSENPETPKRSHGALEGVENEESTVEKASKKKRLNEVEVKARMEGIMDVVDVQF